MSLQSRAQTSACPHANGVWCPITWPHGWSISEPFNETTPGSHYCMMCIASSPGSPLYNIIRRGRAWYLVSHDQLMHGQQLIWNTVAFILERVSAWHKRTMKISYKKGRFATIPWCPSTATACAQPHTIISHLSILGVNNMRRYSSPQVFWEFGN